MVGAGASKDYVPSPTPPLDTTSTSWVLRSLLPAHLVVESPNMPGIPPEAFHPLLKESLQLVSKLVATLLRRRQFGDQAKWQRCVGSFLGL